AYVEPVVTLDMDVVIAAEDVERIVAFLAAEFRITEFPHSLNLNDAGSDLRVQIQRDPRYSDFVDRAETHEVLGMPMPVASVEDVLQGKIWAATDPDRRELKRKKDELDIARIVDKFPRLRDRVPPALL